MSKYSTENLTPFAGGSTLVSYELLTHVIAEITSMPPWYREFFPALLKLRDEFITVQQKIEEKNAREQW